MDELIKNDPTLPAKLALFGLACIFGLVIGIMAIRKNRSFLLWGFFGFFTFLVAGIALAFSSYLCPKCKKSLTNQQWRDRTCPTCGKI